MAKIKPVAVTVEVELSAEQWERLLLSISTADLLPPVRERLEPLGEVSGDVVRLSIKAYTR